MFNQWGSTAYGWGIQLKLHHHYQCVALNQNASRTLICAVTGNSKRVPVLVLSCCVWATITDAS